MTSSFHNHIHTLIKAQCVLGLTGLATLMSSARAAIVERRILLIAIGLICHLSPPAMASETHEAHVHGVANLTLAFESGALELQLESPAMSLFGFEHKPKTEDQIKTIERTKEILSSTERVVSIDGANCTVNTADVKIHGPAGQTLRKSEGHDDHGSNDKHDGHDASHSEVSAMYRFDCVEGEKISGISIALFESFPSLESIKANWVTETQQGQSILRPKAPIIEFR